MKNLDKKCDGMTDLITFNKQGYDSFIDFIKAYAIVCVLIGHTIPNIDSIGYGLWAGMQVPLFVLIQAFHGLKKNKKIDFKKMFLRILLPFFVIQTLILITLPSNNFKDTIYRGIINGGYGPGAYFPWVFLQIALILPFCRRYTSKHPQTIVLATGLIVCEGFEVLFSIIHLPEFVYRLLAVRYLFLILLADIWIRKGIAINKTTIILSLLSLLSIIYFEYFLIDNEPLFFNTSWKFHRWPCYFYVAFGLCMILYVLHNFLRKNKAANYFIKCLAKSSYEIFLIQMAIIAIFSSRNILTQGAFQNGLRIFLIFVISIIGGFILNRYYHRFLVKFKY